jgi:hypothetical protein
MWEPEKIHPGSRGQKSTRSEKRFSVSYQIHDEKKIFSINTIIFPSCSLSNVHISAAFGPDGLLRSITSLSDGQRTPCALDFARYGTRNRGDRSGAYLFLPDGPGRTSAIARSEVRVVEGRLRACVEVRLGWNVHRVTLFNAPGVDGTAVQVSNICFIASSFWYKIREILKCIDFFSIH